MIVIYHFGCSDGTAGRIAAEKFIRRLNIIKEDINEEQIDVEYIGALHHDIIFIKNENGELIPFTGEEAESKKRSIIIQANQEITFIDFAFTRDKMEFILQWAESVSVLDHHESTISELQGLENPKLRTVLDITRSGCQIAWDELNGGERPPIFDYIADRDLWAWKLPDSKAINAGLFYKYSKDMYSGIKYCVENWSDELKQELKTCGEISSELRDSMAANIAKFATKCKIRVDDRDYIIKITNCPTALKSEVGNILACETGIDFSIVWHTILVPNTTDDKFSMQYWVSLRGNGKHNLSIIAKKIHPNGGGHPNASGLSLDSETDLLNILNQIQV